MKTPTCIRGLCLKHNNRINIDEKTLEPGGRHGYNPVHELKHQYCPIKISIHREP